MRCLWEKKREKCLAWFPVAKAKKLKKTFLALKLKTNSCMAGVIDENYNITVRFWWSSWYAAYRTTSSTSRRHTYYHNERVNLKSMKKYINRTITLSTHYIYCKSALIFPVFASIKNNKTKLHIKDSKK